MNNRARFPKYFLGGLLSTGSDVLIFTFFTVVLGINFLISNSISFTCAVIIAFFFHKHITFEYSGDIPIVKHIFVFFITSIISLGVSNTLIFIFITYAHLIPLIAKCVQVCISYPFNYFMVNRFVFNSK
jgi:putative flippase GtrA